MNADVGCLTLEGSTMLFLIAVWHLNEKMNLLIYKAIKSRAFLTVPFPCLILVGDERKNSFTILPLQIKPLSSWALSSRPPTKTTRHNNTIHDTQTTKAPPWETQGRNWCDNIPPMRLQLHSVLGIGTTKCPPIPKGQWYGRQWWRSLWGRYGTPLDDTSFHCWKITIRWFHGNSQTDDCRNGGCISHGIGKMCRVTQW